MGSQMNPLVKYQCPSGHFHVQQESSGPVFCSCRAIWVGDPDSGKLMWVVQREGIVQFGNCTIRLGGVA